MGSTVVHLRAVEGDAVLCARHRDNDVEPVHFDVKIAVIRHPPILAQKGREAAVTMDSNRVRVIPCLSPSSPVNFCEVRDSTD